MEVSRNDEVDPPENKNNNKKSKATLPNEMDNSSAE